MFETLKFMVVEDMERDREEVLNQLADAVFEVDNLLASPSSFQEAMEALSDHAEELDVVFLDLNLLRDDTDLHPERGHGRKLLDTIHRSYNPRRGIRVVVVSSEDLLNGFADQNMYDAWPGTLVSIAQKSVLSKTLKSSLKRLRKDPLAQQIRRAKVDGVLAHYECVVDATQPVSERLKAARALAVRLVRNEVDHHLGGVNSTRDYADNLSGLIHDHIESRFSPSQDGRCYIDIGRIQSDGGWSAFLWRGATVQHLYALNQYRNTFEHLRERPYDEGSSARWNIPVTLWSASVQDTQREQSPSGSFVTSSTGTSHGTSRSINRGWRVKHETRPAHSAHRCERDAGRDERGDSRAGPARES